MTLDELDKKLASWTTNLASVSSNLTQIEEGISFQTAKTTQLAGDTDTKCHEAFTTQEKLWEYLKLIRDVVDTAVEKRAAVPRLIGRQQAIDDIEKLLTGQSIQLSAVAVPLHERGLLSAAMQRQTTSPDELLKAMEQSYIKVRDFFNTLRNRWLALADISTQCAADLEDLQGRLNKIGKPMPADVTDIEHRLKTFNRTRANNPLALQPEKFKTEIGNYFAKARILVQRMEHEREAIGGDVKRAYTRLEEVRIVRTAALEAQKRVEEKLAGVTLEQPQKTKELSDQLEVIKAALEAKRFGEVETGLDAWNREATRMEGVYKQIAQNMEALLQKAANVRARMTAAQRQRAENAEKGLVPDKALDKFQEKFEEADREKFDVAAAEMAVTSFETRMAGLIASWDNAPADQRLKRRLEKAKADAEAHDFTAHKALTNFAKAAEDAIKDGKLDVAENWIHSYEVKLAELKVNPPKATQPQTTAQPAETPQTQAPAPTADRKTELSDRLVQARAKAQSAGHGEDKALGKFAEKAQELLDKGDFDGAENMVHSYEIRQSELAAKPVAQPVEEPAPTTAESLRKRLTDAQERASKDNVNPSKALKAFAQNAEEALAAGDLKTAEDMILSYETRLNELLAHGQG